MQFEQERGNHSEVVSAAARCPKEIGMGFLIGGDEAAIGQYHIHFQQVIDRQALCAGDIAGPAAQCQPTDFYQA
jgi:hypothetical protein